MLLRKGNFTGKSLLVIILVVLSLLFYKNSINEFPTYIHAWAQGDRYALALGFERNNLDLFHPETYNLNPQFPAKATLNNPQGITAVDFPIHDYIVGAIMKITANKDPWVFRLYSLIYGLIGLVFLYKLSRLIDNSIEKSIFIVVFTFTSPIFTYYLNGFLPSTTSFASLMIGFYYYYRNILHNKQKDLIIGLLFITLACLSRSSFLVFLVAIICYELLISIRNRNFQKNRFFIFFISFVVFVSYFAYNIYLRRKYGSVFLGSIKPVTNFLEFKSIIKEIYKNWGFQYFTYFHYISIGIIAFFAIIYRIFTNKKLATPMSFFYWLIPIMFIGTLLFFIAMSQQFTAHDYYFIDSFFFPTIILTLILVKLLPEYTGIRRFAFILFLLVASSFFVFKSYTIQKERRITGDWDRSYVTIQNFKKSKELLSSLNIPQNARILVIDAYSPNIPFILMERKGYAILTTSYENIEASLAWGYDYILIQNQFFISDVIAGYPKITSYLKRIGGNKELSVFKYSPQNNSTSTPELLGFNPKDLILQEMNDFELHNKANWADKGISDMLNYYSSNKSIYLNETIEFGPTYTLKIENNSFNNASFLFVEGVFKITEAFENISVVFTLDQDNENKIYESFNLKDYIRPKNNFQNIKLGFPISKPLKKGQNLNVYIWNKSKSKCWIDDFKIEIYK